MTTMSKLACVLAAMVGVSAGAQVNFTVVHINDFHARVEGLNKYASPCSPSADDDCDGGWPRLFTAAKQIVDEQSPKKVIFVDAGDEFMGTLWSSYYQGAETSQFLNQLCDTRANGGAGFHACITTFGNHEFDFADTKLIEHAQALKAAGNVKLVSSNIVDNCSPAQLGDNYDASVTIDVDGTDVTFVGYTTPETTAISSPASCLDFQDEATALNTVISGLPASSKIVIAVGHSGYDEDQAIAATVNGAASGSLDLVIGGHSHTFLWTEATQGENPNLSSSASSVTPIQGDYPTVSANAPVVQAYWSGRYLGRLDVSFDSTTGLLESHTAKTVLLGSSAPESLAAPEYQFAKDPTAQALVDSLAGALISFGEEVVGQSLITLDGSREKVRMEEMPIGNVICDAMLASINGNSGFTSDYGNVDLCLMNSGGIRSSIDQGDTSVGEVLAVLPFGNVVSVIELTGAQVWLMAEHGVARYGAQKGEFGQFGSGFQLEFAPNLPPACGTSEAQKCVSGAGVVPNRVQSIMLNGNAIVNDASTKYLLITNDFLARGGDSYEVLTEGTVLLGTGELLDEIVRDYFKAETAGTNGGVTASVEGRVTQDTTLTVSPTSSPTTTSSPTSSPVTQAPVEGAEEEEEGLAPPVVLGLVGAALFVAIGLTCMAPKNEKAVGQEATVAAKVDGTY